MKIKKLLTVVFFGSIMFTGCEKSDENPVLQTVQLRDYGTQYNADILLIEDYLKTHSITVTNHAGFVDDQDATFTEKSSFVKENDRWFYRDALTES